MNAYFNGYVVKEVEAIITSDTAITINANGNSLSLTNNGANTIYIGTTSAVTSANGYPLKADASTMIKNTIYVVMESGATGDLRTARLEVI